MNNADPDWKMGKRNLERKIKEAEAREITATRKLIDHANEWIGADASNSQQMQRQALSRLYDAIIAHKIAVEQVRRLRAIHKGKGFGKKRRGRKKR